MKSPVAHLPVANNPGCNRAIPVRLSHQPYFLAFVQKRNITDIIGLPLERPGLLNDRSRRVGVVK
jgi:hypothetical protein